MLLVKLDAPSSRARYSVGHLLGRMTGWDFAFAASEEEFRSSPLPRLRYGARSDADDPALVIHASGWLLDGMDVLPEPTVGTERGLQVLYPSSAGDDPFAGAFYLMSRCEELEPRIKDEHGRLPSAEHFMVRHGIEQLPVIDHWMWRLTDALRSRFPELPEPHRRYNHTLTVDVDNAFKFLGRP